MIAVILLAGSTTTATASNLCSRFFSSTLLVFRDDYLPRFSTRVFRSKDGLDLYLLKESYLRGNYFGPIEMGRVEILDRTGKVLDWKMVQGTNQKIEGLNSAAQELLARNSEKLDEIALIRKSHTHPDEKGQNIISEAFSDGDMSSDRSLRAFLSADPAYKKIKFESWIIYLDHQVERFTPSALELPHVKIRGYQVGN